MISLATQVSDFSTRFNARGRAGLATLTGELNFKGSVQRNFSQDVIFDDDTPQITGLVIRSPTVTIGKSVSAAVRAVDTTATTVQVALIDGTDQTMAKVTQPLRSTGEGKWLARAIQLPTNKVQLPGDYFVIARVTDSVGKTVESNPKKVRIVKPADPTQPNNDGEKLGKGTIKGKIVFSTNKRKVESIKPFKVSIKDNEEVEPAMTTSGEFTLKDVPPGNHTLEAVGPFQGKERTGEKKIKLLAKEHFLQQFVIEVE